MTAMMTPLGNSAFRIIYADLFGSPILSSLVGRKSKCPFMWLSASILPIDMFEHLFEHGEASVAPVLAPDLAALRAQIRRLEGQETPGDVVGFAVPEALRSAFPSGLRAGAAYAVSGSLTLALVLLAEACRQGAWCAIVGLPGLGMEVAARQGLDLDRVLLVPAPGDQWSTVVAALAEIVPVVLAAPVRLPPG